MKQVPACEYNPFEAIKTNVLGAQNIIDAAIDCGVPRVLALSTDKAVNPVNLYGASKLAAEKLFVQGNAYAGTKNTRFACVRYGNVVGSRGSVIPLFLEQRRFGRVTLTDERMTRFWLTLDQGVAFVVSARVRVLSTRANRPTSRARVPRLGRRSSARRTAAARPRRAPPRRSASRRVRFAPRPTARARRSRRPA
jgi:nucleoside-diphosphate-sugar epimerase